uniref:Ig-like domain-containing protein n=1 Tax=Cyprinus carpio TaxID=7962 RepID=A0A8C2EWW4_CYPCA
FPDFTAESVADDRRMSHYNHETEDWIVMTLTEYPVIEGLEEPYDPRDWYKDQLKILSNCTQNSCCETGYCHVLQRIIGCKLEKFPNGTVQSLHVFDEYGFDGNDLMAFNYDTMQWIDKSPNAKEIKKDWDRHTDRKQDLHQYLKICMDWISKFNNTNKNSPDVYIFVRKAPDDHSKLVLICLVTGFYPRDIEMNIRLNRINIESQISSGIRPNDDETFQMRSSVKIDRNHRGSYDCHVIHSSLTEPVTVEWALLGTIIALVFGVYCYKKRRSNGEL